MTVQVSPVHPSLTIIGDWSHSLHYRDLSGFWSGTILLLDGKFLPNSSKSEIMWIFCHNYQNTLTSWFRTRKLSHALQTETPEDYKQQGSTSRFWIQQFQSLTRFCWFFFKAQNQRWQFLKIFLSFCPQNTFTKAVCGESLILAKGWIQTVITSWRSRACHLFCNSICTPYLKIVFTKSDGWNHYVY